MKKSTILLVGFILGCALVAHKSINDKYLLATLYQSHSAEYVALCEQAYNAASIQLDNELRLEHSRPMAVVVDIDETVLNNILQVEQQIIDKKRYTEKYWNQWVDACMATPVAGACEFLNHAAENGVETFYITNRVESQREKTLENLQNTGFPFADDEHLIMKEAESSKETRRDKVSETHDIVILCGDNLSDFSSLFDEPDETVRLENTMSNQKEFGVHWIVLPNATYGNWLNAIEKQSKHHKIKARFYRKMMKGYRNR